MNIIKQTLLGLLVIFSTIGLYICAFMLLLSPILISVSLDNTSWLWLYGACVFPLAYAAGDSI